MSDPENSEDEHRRHEADREREYTRRARGEKLFMMAAMIASGMSGRSDSTPTHIAKRSIEIAQHILDQVEALP